MQTKVPDTVQFKAKTITNHKKKKNHNLCTFLCLAVVFSEC